MGCFQLFWVAAACALASLAAARDLPAAPRSPAMESGGPPLAADPPSTFAIGVVVGRRMGIAPAVLGHIRRHRPDRSVAGADVILGGLVTAMLAAVACYIRVTRNKKAGEEE